MPRFFVLALSFLSFVTACGGESTPPPQAAPPPSNAPAPPTATGAPGATLSPQLEEAIGRVKALTVETTDATIATTFSPTFLAAIPADKMKALFTAPCR
jgi:hypothetical protein